MKTNFRHCAAESGIAEEEVTGMKVNSWKKARRFTQSRDMRFAVK
jgi:hypothetical protein